MSVVAVYNMKGGVGKTTTAVNLSHQAASDRRVLLWDLDPQGASSFAFRVRPRVERFSKKWIQSGQVLADGIRETDYGWLDLLPADFTHRKLERLLGSFSKPARVMAGLIETARRDYDVVILDCPAGFSLLTEGVFAAADLIVVPTIPTVLSLRMVATLIDWSARAEAPSDLAPFLSMVDRRKTLHRQICEWTSGQSDTFLTAQVPYASVVEQMAVRRAPLATFAPRDVATAAFAHLWTEIQARLAKLRTTSHQSRDSRRFLHRAIESLVVRLESEDADVTATVPPMPVEAGGTRWTAEHPAPRVAEVAFIHRFDTDRGDLQWRHCLLELHERAGRFLLVAETSGRAGTGDVTKRTEAHIEASWAASILAGTMSPLEALERRLGSGGSPLVEQVRTATQDRLLGRVQSRAADTAVRDDTFLSATPVPQARA